MPILARTGSSTPSSTKVACPSFGATQGVAGAMMTSTDLNSSIIWARYQRRNFCARSISGAGIMAPARAEMIEAEHKGKRAGARQPSVGRLQPENAAERRRHPDRAVGVRPQRQRHQGAADRAAGTARGAAGHPRHVMRIARRTVVHILAGEVVGVFT